MHKSAQVADGIMSCFAIGLGLPEDYYKEVTCTREYANVPNMPTLCAHTASSLLRPELYVRCVMVAVYPHT